MILVKHRNAGNLETHFYLALEDYLLNEVMKEDESYFFTWRIKGVVIGKNQILENEVNLDYVKAHNIKVFRRQTGGGTVYADERNTMFSLISKREENFSFKKHLIKIIDAIALLGVDLTFSGRNDILLGERKVSGNAFLQNKNGMILHGTLLYDCDLETMVRAITPSDEKLVSKGIASVSNRVVNLKPYLNGMSQEALIEHLEKELTNSVYELSDEEIVLIQKRAEVYASKEWLYQQRPTYIKTLSKRIKGGLFNVNITLKEGRINNLEISGDYFDLLPVENLTKQFKDQLYTKETIEKLLNEIDVSQYFLDIDETEFKQLIIEGTLL